MPPYHLERYTGVIRSCPLPGACPLPASSHYESREAAYKPLLRQWEGQVARHRQPAPLVAALEALVARGLTLPPPPRSLLLHQQLLEAEGSFSSLKRLYRDSRGGRQRRETIARVAATLLRRQPQRRGEWEREFGGVLPMGPDLVLRLPLLFQATPPEEEWVGSHLWLPPTAPLHALAELLLMKPVKRLEGYHSLLTGERKTFQVAAIVEELGLRQEDLPPGVVAYDVETDTRRGLGLVPSRTQITEVVLAQREEAIVLSGDERFILSQVAVYLSSLPAATLLVGWNNHNYDNIMLQTRAEFHRVKGWQGEVVPTSNHTIYRPRGLEGASLRLQWRLPSGGLLQDSDGYQLLSSRPRRQGTPSSLKGFVKGLGGLPREVDRQQMHLLSPEERAVYALSDGLATLRAWGALIPPPGGETVAPQC